MAERIQKILAQAGCGSRRACEDLIAAGRVRVDGHVATLGQRAEPGAVVTLDGHRVAPPASLTYVALYKPRYVISTLRDPAGRPTVRDLVPEPAHLFPVGRLDWESEGLVLMTNDGDLANRLTHPRYGHTKEYRVLVARRPAPEQLATWRRGVVLNDGYRTAPAEVHIESGAGKGTWLRVIMGEGRKRQIRETAAGLGLPVVRIIRVRIATLHLGTLKPKDWRHLSSEEIRRLKMPGNGKVGSPRKTDQGSPPAGSGPARSGRGS